jgi:hypothetical protein
MTAHDAGESSARISRRHSIRRMAISALAATLLTAVIGTVPASAAPAIGGTADASYSEGDPATLVAPSLTIADGLAYGGQYLEFAIDGAVTGETLGLQDDGAADTTDGVVSVVGSSVYLGNGTTADAIASIDGIANGEDGADLRINFTSEFANAGFETGDLTGWTPLTQQIDLGTTEIAGCTTVDTSTYPAQVTNEDNNVPDILGSLTTPVVTDVVSEGTYALRLWSDNMNTLAGFDVVHGPAVYSSPFEAAAGDKIYFDWRAVYGDDNYHVFGYIVDESCTQTELLDATGSGSTSWATKETTIPVSGTYRFVFVSGTFDASGGEAAGASLYIDNVQVFGNKATDAVAQEIARKVTYVNTDEEAVGPTRTLDITVQSVAEGSATGSVTINVATDPAVTTGLTVTMGNGEADLSWGAPDAGTSPITDYVVEYSSDGGTTWTTFDDGVSTDTSTTVTGLTNGVDYVFRVAAVSDIGAGPYSTQSDPDAPEATVPAVPANVTANADNGEVGLSWDAPDSGGSAITDYVIEWSADGGTTWETFDDGVSTAVATTVTGLTNGTEYRFRIGAVNAVGTGTPSAPVAATPQDLPPFVDTDDSVFVEDIRWLQLEHITVGCNPPLNTDYCPDISLTRAETAAFLDRWLGLAGTAVDFFTDDDGTLHEAALNRTAAAGVFRGCNPPANDLVCPDDVITRGEAAAVLVRAMGLVANEPVEFVDAVGTLFESEIGILGANGLTRGCNPPANDRYCPGRLITRGEMAALLHRADGL